MPVRTTLRRTKKIVVKPSKKRGPSIKILGRVVHYYDRIGVAIVELAAPIKVGDTVKVKRGDFELLQPVHSLQLDHTPVASAKKGAVVGMKVNGEVAEGALVMPA